MIIVTNSSSHLPQWRLSCNVERDRVHGHFVEAQSIFQIESMMHRELRGELWGPLLHGLCALAHDNLYRHYTLDVSRVAIWIIQFLPEYQLIKERPEWQAIWDRLMADESLHSCRLAHVVCTLCVLQHSKHSPLKLIVFDRFHWLLFAYCSIVHLYLYIYIYVRLYYLSLRISLSSVEVVMDEMAHCLCAIRVARTADLVVLCRPGTRPKSLHRRVRNVVV